MKKVILLLAAACCVYQHGFAMGKEKERELVSTFLWSDILALPQDKRPKIALVLGGGGARGLAHIGVLKVLEQESIPIDMVVGTSVGALVGALYCAGLSISEIEQLGERTGWNKLSDISTAALVKLLVAEELLSSARMEKYLEGYLGGKRFEDLNIPFACVATDIQTGEKIIFKEGEVLIAIRASSTVPGLFKPVEYRHRFLVDGGLVDNTPTDIAKLMGADIIIAVTLKADFSKFSLDNVLKILNQSIFIQGMVIDKELLKLADMVITPELVDISAIDLWKSKECMDAGEIAARKSAEELKNMIIGRTMKKIYGQQ